VLPHPQGLKPNFLEGNRERYGDVFSISFPLLSADPVAVIYGTPEVRELLGTENELVVSSWPSTIVQLLGQTSLTGVRGEEHRRLRQVQPNLQ
jgi:cytochrome P450